jgi:uncharacterized heparinase superfamily protein
MAVSDWPLQRTLLRLARFADRVQNRLSARVRPFSKRPKGLSVQPEPRVRGNYSAGMRLMEGEFRFAGSQISAEKRSIWDLPYPDSGFAAEVHGMGWADDLATVGDSSARRLFQSWVMDWVRRFGNGTGPGWQPDLAGRRLVRWITHSALLLGDLDPTQGRRLLSCLGRHASYLRVSWYRTRPGLPRFEALTGLLYAGLALEGREALLKPAISLLGQEAERQIGPDGGIPSRSPEELNEIFALLTSAAQSLQEFGHQPDGRHLEALVRAAPTLRSLRLGDGLLARFHGGGTGPEGRLDQSLADAGVKGVKREELAMGFARIAAGRAMLVMDCAAPPSGRASAQAHASTLAFELTTGRRRLIVNTGPGRGFGRDWMLKSRLTPAQSSLSVERTSSSRLALKSQPPVFSEVPGEVVVHRASDLTGSWIQATHNGYEPTHGLIHERRVYLAASGKEVGGEDILTSPRGPARAKYAKAVAGAPQLGIMFTLHFHLHPEVEASIDAAASIVSLRLKSGERWTFRQHGGELHLVEGTYLDPAFLRPKASHEIRVTGRVVQYAGDVTWSLQRVEDGTANTRDLVQDDAPIES